MPWVTFSANFDWTPPADRRVTKAYRAGTTENVTRDCAAAAKAAGKATAAKRPASRAEANAVRAGEES
jgi:hypothetical protein